MKPPIYIKLRDARIVKTVILAGDEKIVADLSKTGKIVGIELTQYKDITINGRKVG